MPLVGRSRALEIAVTGEDYDAETAQLYDDTWPGRPRRPGC
jgi:hypothetical protein